MTAGCPEPLVAVGKPCDCGHPLVWVRGSQRCAVYGTHPTPDDRVTFRNLQAPGYDAPLDAWTAPAIGGAQLKPRTP